MRRIAVLGVPLLVTLLYLPAAHNGFLYDDYAVILDPPAPSSAGEVAQLFIRPYYPGSTYYRPVTWLSFLGQRALQGPSPTPFHLLNAVLIGIIAALAYRLLRLPAMRLGSGAASLAVLLFALHPVASSCVYPISGRDTLLAALFMLASTNAYLRRGRGLELAGAGLFALALLSKEMAVALPAVVLTADLLELSGRRPRAAREWLRRYGPMVAVLMTYFVVRQFLFSEASYERSNPAHVPLSFVYALQVVIVPFRDLYYEPLVGAWLSWWRLLLTGAVVGLGAWLIGRRRAVPRGPVWFWVGWFVILLLPTANLVEQETLFAERYVFLAGLAVFALAALAVERPGSSVPARRWVAGGAVVLAAVYALIGLHRGQFFDEVEFYRQWIRQNPASAKAHYNLGETLFNRGDPQGALAMYEQALRIEPRYSKAHNNLGKLLVQSDFDRAMQHFRQAVRFDPRNAQAQNNLGGALMLRGKLPEAVERLRLAVELDPAFTKARKNLARALAAGGNHAEAVEQFREVLRLNPADGEAHYGLGDSLRRLGRFGEARDHLRRARELLPPSPGPGDRP